MSHFRISFEGDLPIWHADNFGKEVGGSVAIGYRHIQVLCAVTPQYGEVWDPVDLL